MSDVLGAIEIKKQGGELSSDQIADVIGDYTAGQIPDYQMAALLMAVRLRGMTERETIDLTRVMAESGPTYSFPDCVDKHSTGGVGDKLTLTSLPLVAACGVPVAKLSGRGLGITGGTIDKLESIPGWSADLSARAFRKQVRKVGLVVGAAGELAPADKALYALRDITGTVDSLPLIGSSIVSKKVATGAGHLLYDVKAGSGAFTKTLAEATELAELLVRLSAALGVRAAAVITGMDTPLGSAIGNALEVAEAVAFLQGEDVAPDLAEVALDEAARLLRLHGVRDAAERVAAAHTSGQGYEKFARFVAAQGGKTAKLEKLAVSTKRRQVLAGRDGYVESIDALGVAQASLTLGAGRRVKTDRIDHSAGVRLHVGVGERVSAGDLLATLYGERDVEAAFATATAALRICDDPVAPVPRVLGEVDLLETTT